MQNWVCQCPLAQMFFALRKGCEMPLVSAAGASLGLAVRRQRQDPCSYLCVTFSHRLDCVACDSSCIPLCCSLTFRFPSSPTWWRSKEASLLLSLLPALVCVPCSVLVAPAWLASVCISILVFSLWSALLVLLVILSHSSLRLLFPWEEMLSFPLLLELHHDHGAWT